MPCNHWFSVLGGLSSKHIPSAPFYLSRHVWWFALSRSVWFFPRCGNPVLVLPLLPVSLGISLHCFPHTVWEAKLGMLDTFCQKAVSILPLLHSARACQWQGKYQKKTSWRFFAPCRLVKFTVDITSLSPTLMLEGVCPLSQFSLEYSKFFCIHSVCSVTRCHIYAMPLCPDYSYVNQIFDSCPANTLKNTVTHNQSKWLFMLTLQGCIAQCTGSKWCAGEDTYIANQL